MGIPESIDPRFAPGVVLAGKYRVERVLGRGGMGLVLAAHHAILNQTVAIKLLLADSDIDAARRRFVREARALAQLKSPHVARVLDIGELEDDVPYMVMELLEGEDLDTTLKREGALTVQAAADVGLQTCRALEEAHGNDLVHRDLKPSNLFLARTPDGQTTLKVIDFGIAKSTKSVDASVTATATMVGSPAYMSPEQVRSPKNVDVRSDIWSLGVVLYELVTGAPPFDHQTLGEVFAAIVTDPILPASQRNPAVDAAFDAVLSRCLERDIERRFQSVRDLAQALTPFASAEIVAHLESLDTAPSLRISGSRPVVGASSSGRLASSTIAATSTAVDPVHGAKRGQRGWVSALGVVALVLASVAGTWVWTTRRAAQPTAPAAAIPDPGAPPPAAPAASAQPAEPAPTTQVAPSPAASATHDAPTAKKTPPKKDPHAAPRPTTRTKPAKGDVLEGRD